MKGNDVLTVVVQFAVVYSAVVLTMIFGPLVNISELLEDRK